MKKKLSILLALIPLISQASATYYFNFTNYSKKYFIQLVPDRIKCIDSITFQGTSFNDGNLSNRLNTPIKGVQVVDKNPWLYECYNNDKIANFKILDPSRAGKVIQSVDFTHREEEHGSTHWVTTISFSADDQQPSYVKDLTVVAMCKKHGVDAQYYKNCFYPEVFPSDDDQDIDVYFRDNY